MNYSLVAEEEILELRVRKKIIDEITGPENVARKNEALKRYDIYRDNTVKWVIEKLSKEGLKAETLEQMSNRAANVSICRKIVNKLARCYVGGVQRTSDGEANQLALDSITKLLELDSKMKKADKYRELFKNAMIQIVPELVGESDEKVPKHKLKMKVMAPWQYDVVENWRDHELPRVVILSDFTERNRGIPTSGTPALSDGRDQAIADNPEDQGAGCKRKFIWWSGKYHFTTDDKGTIINELSPDDRLNPIQMLPFVKVSEDQDGEFWAKGGEDLIDGSILVNTLLTDMFSLAYIQGWGQMVVIGDNIPELLTGGPHNAIVIAPNPSSTVQPKVEFVSANPPLDMWMKSVEQYVALILSTNNLSPSNLSAKLDASTFPSGVSMLIEQSEATGNVEDKQKVFQDVEQSSGEIIEAWQNYLFERDALTPEWMDLGKLQNLDINLKFTHSKPPITEKEKLETIKLRQELGLNEMVDLIQMDNPDLTKEEAEEKLKRIMEEKLNRMNSMLVQGLKQATTPPVDGGTPPTDGGTPPEKGQPNGKETSSQKAQAQKEVLM